MNKTVAFLNYIIVSLSIIAVVATVYQTFILSDFDLLAWDDETEEYITYEMYLEL